MNFRVHTFIALLGSCTLLSLNGMGQSDTSRSLKPIPVFAHRDTILKLSELKSSVPTYFIKSDKLAELGAVDAGDAVKTIPGVQLRDYGGIGGIKTISFRSLAANHTKVVYDGNIIHDNQTGTINLSTLDLLGVRSISFSTGRPRSYLVPATTYLSANVINVNSEMNVRQKKPELRFYSNLTTINAYENGMQFILPKGKFQFSGSGIIRHGNGQYTYKYPILGDNEEYKRVHSGLFEYRLKTNLAYSLKNARISGQFHYRNNEQELPGAVVLYNPYNDQKIWNKDLQSNLNYRFSKNKWSGLAHAFYQQNYTRYNDPTFLNAEGFIDLEYLQQFGGGGFLLSRKLGDRDDRIFIGSDLHYNELASSEIVVNPNRLQSNSVIGIKKWLLKNKLLAEFNTSLQLIRDNFESDKLLERKAFTEASPFLSLAWLPFKKEAIRIRTFYKRTFRMPTFNDLYYNYIGNTALDPETVHLFNLGLTYGKSWKRINFEFTADGYYNNVRNKIIAVPTKDLFNWSMQNIGKTEAKGVDVGLLFAVKLKSVLLTLNSNHNFNETLDRTDPESATYGHQIPYTPYYSSSHSISIKWKGFGLNSNLLYNGFRFSLNENIYANILPGFADWNIGLSKNLKFGKDHRLLLHLKMMNVLDNNYEVIRSYPMPGRHYQLTMRLKI